MGREIFDRLYKTLTEEYAKANERLKHQIQVFLSDQSEIRMYNPQIEMFARFKMKSSFHKTKRII